MSARMLLWTHLVLAVYAQELQLPARGTFKPGPGDTSQVLQAFAAAGQQPNASNSVTFSRTFNNNAEDWTWHINVTDLAISDRTSDLGNPSASFSRGLHVTNTQWQLQWPGNSDTLQSLLSERNMEITFDAISILKSSNVTDPYNADDNGDCTKLLGSECTESIKKVISKGSTLQMGFPACRDTLGINGFNQQGGTGSIIRPEINTTEQNLLRSNSTLFYSTTKTYPANDLDVFNQSKHALQVLAMNFESPDGTSDPIVLCRIVEKAPSTPEATNAPEVGSAVSWTQSTAVIWVTAILSTLGIML